jgi:hypothetical protein
VRITPSIGFCALSNTDHVVTMSSVSETPREASAIIPEFDEISSLADSAEMDVSEVTVTPIDEVTA